MFGLVVLFFLGIYLFLQCFFAPWLGWTMARNGGYGEKARRWWAFAGFLLIFVPVWHTQLPAMIVYQCLKPSCGSRIYKPFEQWEAENPDVLAKLEKTEQKQLIAEQKRLGDKYPNEFIEHKGIRCELWIEYRSNGKPRLGWYSGGKGYLGERVGKTIDVWYDIEKQEVLADRVRAYLRFWGFEGPDFGAPAWYHGVSSPDKVGFYGYMDFFLKENKE